MEIPARWRQRLEALVRTLPEGPPQASTLELFFAEVRWSEEVRPDGQRTLRRGTL